MPSLADALILASFQSPSVAHPAENYSPYHWLIIAALLGYIWLLVKLAKPKPITKPVNDSRGWLLAQTFCSWFCILIFGILLLAMVAGNANRQSPHRSYDLADAVGYFVGYLITTLGVPLGFSLSIRWARAVKAKRNWLRSSPVAPPQPSTI